MSRVNKVLISPQAVVADGGALCSSGHLMVAVAAKEFSVPVVGVAGAFMLTPLFAHNQVTTLCYCDTVLCCLCFVLYHAMMHCNALYVTASSLLSFPCPAWSLTHLSPHPLPSLSIERCIRSITVSFFGHQLPRSPNPPPPPPLPLSSLFLFCQ